MNQNAPEAPLNLDFEDGVEENLPIGWHSPTHTQGYPVKLTKDHPKSGRFCVMIERSERDVAAEGSIGNIMQSIDATRYRGKRLRLTGWARTGWSFLGIFRRYTGSAQAWLRVDRAGGKIGFLTRYRPIRSKTWQRFEIVGDVADDAEFIYFGLGLHGNGRARLDDLKLDVVGSTRSDYQPPVELNEVSLDNLIALTRLLGFVRYFYPARSVADTNWDLFTVVAVRKIQNIQSSEELARELSSLFNSIAPAVQISTSTDNFIPIEVPSEPTDDKQFRYWRHYGVGLSEGPSLYSSKLLVTTTPPVSSESPIVSEIGNGLSVLVPVAVPIANEETFEGAPYTTANEDDLPAHWTFSGNDRSTRLADIALAWNIFQHFYPYFDVVDVDWSDALRTFLVAAAADENEQKFSQTLSRLIAKLEDGHGRVIFDYKFLPAVAFDWVDDDVVVTAVDETIDQRLQPGHVVTRIDECLVSELVPSLHEQISAATPAYLRFRTLQELFRGTQGSKVSITTRSPTYETNTFTIERDRALGSELREPRPEQGTELDDGVLYVDLDRIEHIREFNKLKRKLKKADGIVFDLRGYPSFGFIKVISHLIDRPVTSAQWHVPITHSPDRIDTQFRFSNWKVQPKSPRLTKNIAFITDGRAISAAETLLGIIEHYNLAEIVGGSTAGTNGDFATFTLPGNYHVVFTGLRVLKHDGSRHHGIGIQPTVPISRTIEGIAAGRDELLEKAVAVVTEKKIAEVDG